MQGLSQNLKKPKVSLIGAGNVGMRYAYSLLIKGLVRSLVIVDIDKKRTEGEVLDLASAVSFASPIELINGDYVDIKGSEIVVITAGKKQKPGQTRLGLAGENYEVFKDIIPKIMRYAPQAIFLVVTNPVDVLSYAAYKLSGKNWQEVICCYNRKIIDEMLLSQHCKVDARNIHAYILGEHGDTEFCAWSKAMIGGAFLKDYCNICKGCQEQMELENIFKEVRDFAYKIIACKGETSYGIGLALARISEAILKDENSILSVSCLIKDYYGISDVYLSLPAVVNRKGIREILKLTLEPQEIKALKNSVQIIKEVIKGLKL